MRRRLSVLIALMVAALTLATPAGVAATGAKLTGGTVSPMSGTTATVFQFSVHFVGTATDEALTVTASVAGKTIPLARNGTPRNGTWTGSSTLPAGSWTVTYRSTSTMGTNPSFPVPGQVVVTAPTPRPSPTIAPTPRPTQRPTPRPTAVPATPAPGASITPGVSQTPYATTVPGASGSSGASASASMTLPSASASPAQSDSPPFNVPPEGIVAIGLLGAVTVAAALGERRRRIAVEAFRAAQPPAGGEPPPMDGQVGAERDIVDDETVATIDYDSPGEPEGTPEQ